MVPSLQYFFKNGGSSIICFTLWQNNLMKIAYGSGHTKTWTPEGKSKEEFNLESHNGHYCHLHSEDSEPVDINPHGSLTSRDTVPFQWT